MANYCSHCGAKVVGAEARCLQCGTRFGRGPGWLSRLIDRLFGRAGVDGDEDPVVLDGPGSPPAQSMQSWSLTRQSRITHTPKPGTPAAAELDRALEEHLKSGGLVVPPEGFVTTRREEYRYTDASGVEKCYTSLNEMPPEVRRLFEKIVPPEMR